MSYKFLADNSIPPKVAIRLGATTIPRMEDEDVIRKAFDEEYILLSTEQRFIQKCKNHQQHTVGKGNRCCFGLVILYPDTEHAQLRALDDLRSGRRRLRYRGGPITWRDVSNDNLIVRIEAEGDPRVEELCNCEWDEE